MQVRALSFHVSFHEKWPIGGRKGLIAPLRTGSRAIRWISDPADVPASDWIYAALLSAVNSLLSDYLHQNGLRSAHSLLK